MPCIIQVCTNSRKPAFCWKRTQRTVLLLLLPLLLMCLIYIKATCYTSVSQVQLSRFPEGIVHGFLFLVWFKTHCVTCLVSSLVFILCSSSYVIYNCHHKLCYLPNIHNYITFMSSRLGCSIIPGCAIFLSSLSVVFL